MTSSRISRPRIIILSGLWGGRLFKSCSLINRNRGRIVIVRNMRGMDQYTFCGGSISFVFRWKRTFLWREGGSGREIRGRKFRWDLPCNHDWFYMTGPNWMTPWLADRLTDWPTDWRDCSSYIFERKMDQWKKKLRVENCRPPKGMTEGTILFLLWSTLSTNFFILFIISKPLSSWKRFWFVFELTLKF